MAPLHQPSLEHNTSQPSLETLQETVSKLTAENRELQERNERLEKIATKDPLTGLSNRRGLMETASPLFPSKERGSGEENRGGKPERQRATALLIVDIDHFKKINDDYGHATGDLALQEVARFLQDKIRGTDIISRYGGEEFVIVFRNADAQDVIDKFYQKTDGRAELSFEIELRGKKRIIMLSGGVTDLVTGETIEQTIARADEGLYQAKMGGRNRIQKVSAPQEKV